MARVTGRNERDRKKAGKGSRSPSLSPPGRRRHADPGRSHRLPSPKFWSASATTRWCSCPANSCFPAAVSTRPTTAFPSPHRSPKALEANLLKGSPKITPSRARSLAVAAIREACEETGLCLGRKSNGAAACPRRRLETLFRCRTAPRSLQPVPDRPRHHAARPGAALRYAVFHRRRLGDHPSCRRA